MSRLQIRKFGLGFALVLTSLFVGVPVDAQPASHEDPATDITDTDPKAAAEREAALLSETRQLTFEGRRAGEGYFSQDGKQIVFQSEREPGNPFFQIYVMDLETGDVEQVSPGTGKTTCAWIHPTGKRVLFASTQDDPDALKKQKEELELRSSGKQRRYSWDYDKHFEIYDFNRATGKYTNLTNTLGYDAEGSWSPDGKLIAFASNRRGYEGDLTEDEKKNFEIDPAYLNDIYVMQADGSNVTRLTTTEGYDGGPFFSPDGKRICWRRFTPNGAIAEIMTMNVDGSDQRQLTRLGAMSWAPYYHPSGEYLIFTTNRHGFANFELYLIDAAGKSTPVRVTYTKGFDGLPVFTPDGKQLAWTTNRNASKQSQLFIADWDHDQARELLGLGDIEETGSARLAADESSKSTSVEFTPTDIMRHVDYLCRPELGGRMTGTEGEKLATAYVAAYMDSLGLRPAGDDGTWYQNFEFTSGVALGAANKLTWNKTEYEVKTDWTPLSFSLSGQTKPAPIVFAGYGIAAPKAEDQDEYDSFVHLDVKDKWILALRYMPENISAERRQHLSRYASLRFKAMLARDKGARGLIFVSGPNSNVVDELVRLRFDGSLSGTSIPVISVSNRLAQQWLSVAGKNLKDLQEKLDGGEPMMGFELKGGLLKASVDIKQVKRHGRNVLGRLVVGRKPADQAVVVGAHVDHLGTGPSSSSLARDDERDGIHFGADDNASGVAAMLEVAQYMADQKESGRLKANRDIIFAAWSGEELGLIGSNHFVKTFPVPHEHDHAAPSPKDHGPKEAAGHAADSGKKSPADLHKKPLAEDNDSNLHAKPPSHEPSPGSHHHAIYPAVSACLNMDMVGRFDKKLIVQGVGSSSIWKGEVERRNAPVGLPITLQEDSYLPTDASSFYTRGVPILSAFTGSHAEYHTPRDTPDTLNYEGAANVARFMGLVCRSLVTRADAPDYRAQVAPNKGQPRAGLRAYLGTIPDYAEGDIKGLKLSGVAKTGPAAKAGVKGGDVIVELAGRKVENIYDYTYAIEALKIGQKTKIVVQRNGKRIELEIVPGSRE